MLFSMWPMWKAPTFFRATRTVTFAGQGVTWQGGEVSWQGNVYI